MLVVSADHRKDDSLQLMLVHTTVGMAQQKSKAKTNTAVILKMSPR